MDNYQLAFGTGAAACKVCGQRPNVAPRAAAAPGQERLRLIRLQEITTEQSDTIEALRQELQDRDRRSNAIMAHYEQLVRMEKSLARDAEEAERKAETEIVILTEELERLQSLLATNGIAF
ncbi:unnamed protein product [Discula destructiva]